MSALDPAEWIAVDWGATHLRAWAMRGGAPAAEGASDAGASALSRPDFEPALLAVIGPWLGDGPTPVVVCGMAGAREGWAEAPCRAVPCAPLGGGCARPAPSDRRLAPRIVPGIEQKSPADVMRGEETRIAGFLARRPGFDGVLYLPGAQTRWARISAGEIVGFRSFMTGELFSLLAERSTLRFAVGEGWDDAAFAEAVDDALSRPEALAARLFSLRAEGLLTGLDPGAARARLSGALIGAELAAAKPWWLGMEVAILGESRLARACAAALECQGAAPALADAREATIAGLAGAYAMEWDISP